MPNYLPETKWQRFKRKVWNFAYLPYWWFKHNRIGYCEYPWCGCWTRLVKQQINRSTATAWLCEECADEEQKEVQAAWDEYYSGLL